MFFELCGFNVAYGNFTFFGKFSVAICLVFEVTSLRFTVGIYTAILLIKLKSLVVGFSKHLI